MDTNVDHSAAGPPWSALPDRETCRRARLARDPRFDGEFFLGVRSTGIYCRPICPARPPAEKNVSYFRSAVAAAEAGYRPCLRCRPESAPHSPAWLGTATTVRRALQLIEQGALNQGNLEDLAGRLGVGQRYLRKLFQRELGVSPTAVARNQRLLFARKLLAETDLPLTQVAFAAGFGSVRRFNSAVRGQFRQTPGDLRRHRGTSRPDSGIRLQLHYRPPYDWEGVIGFFARHAVTGVEQVDAGSYERRLWLAGQAVGIRVRPLPRRHALELQVTGASNGQLMPLVATVRRMFDLDANPAAIAAGLGGDPVLGPLLRACPGVRAPGCGSLFEATVRAIVGQQVSTAAARGICARLALACSPDPQHPLFPGAASLAALEPDHFPMPGQRRATLQALCRRYSACEELLDLDALGDAKGVGPWTLDMVRMRGAGEPDAFPRRDLGLERAWRTLGGSEIALSKQAEHWRPWRAYAANLLWRSLAP